MMSGVRPKGNTGSSSSSNNTNNTNNTSGNRKPSKAGDAAVMMVRPSLGDALMNAKGDDTKRDKMNGRQEKSILMEDRDVDHSYSDEKGGEDKTEKGKKQGQGAVSNKTKKGSHKGNESEPWTITSGHRSLDSSPVPSPSTTPQLPNPSPILTPQQAQKLKAADLLRSRGKYRDALAAYDQILVQVPTCLSALNGKGACCKDLGDTATAIACYTAVLGQDPRDWCAHNNLGVIYKDSDALDQACAEYSAAMATAPTGSVVYENMAIALTELGTRLRQRGKRNEAIVRYRQALQFHPRHAPAHFHLGVVAGEAGDQDEAMRCYTKTLELNPEHADALCNMGVILKNKGDIGGAISMYSKALTINPNFTLASDNQAIALTDMGTHAKEKGDVVQSIKHYKKALTHNPKYYSAWYNLGVAYAETGQIDDAMLAYEMATNFHPQCAEAYNNLGVLYKDQGNLDKAIACYKKALVAQPKFVQTLNNMGVIHTMLGKWDEAYKYCSQAVQVDPKYVEAYNNLGVLFRDEGRVVEAIASYDRALLLDPYSRNAGQNRLLALNSLDSLPVNDIPLTDFVSAEHLRWGQLFQRGRQPRKSWPSIDRNFTLMNQSTLTSLSSSSTSSTSTTTSRPLRVGYISADFFTHSVSYFIEAPLAYADRSRVHTICYSNVARSDARTAKLKTMAHDWRVVNGMSAEAVTKLIMDDKIDILVELTGHTSGNRLDVLALRPAPVQITWIGYSNTTGLPTIDYRITDTVADPPNTSQRYSETLVRMPDAFLCYTPPPDAPAISPAPCLTNGFITFGSFNNLAKVTDSVLRLWASVLIAVPTSRFVVKSKPFASETIRSKFLTRLAALGVDSSRVDCLPLMATTNEHLKSYSMVDLALDSFPYAGTTTTCEALYMGVPVLTLRAIERPCHAQNVGSSLISRLTSVDVPDTSEYAWDGSTLSKHPIPSASSSSSSSPSPSPSSSSSMSPTASIIPSRDFVATSPEHFVRLAVAWANAPTRLAYFRSHLRKLLTSSPLCDGPRFTRNLESLYHSLFASYLRASSSEDGSYVSTPTCPPGSTPSSLPAYLAANPSPSTTPSYSFASALSVAPVPPPPPPPSSSTSTTAAILSTTSHPFLTPITPMTTPSFPYPTSVSTPTQMTDASVHPPILPPSDALSSAVTTPLGPNAHQSTHVPQLHPDPSMPQFPNPTGVTHAYMTLPSHFTLSSFNPTLNSLTPSSAHLSAPSFVVSSTTPSLSTHPSQLAYPALSHPATTPPAYTYTPHVAPYTGPHVPTLPTTHQLPIAGLTPAPLSTVSSANPSTGHTGTIVSPTTTTPLNKFVPMHQQHLHQLHPHPHPHPHQHASSGQPSYPYPSQHQPHHPSLSSTIPSGSTNSQHLSSLTHPIPRPKPALSHSAEVTSLPLHNNEHGLGQGQGQGPGYTTRGTGTNPADEGRPARAPSTYRSDTSGARPASHTYFQQIATTL